MTKLIAVVVVAAIVAVNSVAQAAGPSTGDILAIWDGQDTGKRNTAMIYVGGMVAGFFAADSLLQHERKPMIFCSPANAVIDGNELVRMVKAVVASKPALKVLDFQIVALKALEETYPCK